MKLVERELGAHHISADIGCHLFSILPPFHLGNTTMGYGLGTAGASAFGEARGAEPPGRPKVPDSLSGGRTLQSGGLGSTRKRAISVMGDGGFWHNGLTSGIANAVFNRSDNLTIVVDNNYTSATGGQDIPSSKNAHASRSAGHAIEKAVRGVGVEWVRTLKNTYDVAGMRDTLRAALTTREPGPKVIVAQSTPAPATIPASGCRAARRCRSSPTRIRCAPTRWPRCSTPASAVACAARCRMPRCCAPRSTRRASSPTPPGATVWRSACAAR